MSRNLLTSFTLFTCLLIYYHTPVKAQAIIDLESGIVTTGYNDVRIPGKGGTMISLKDDLKPKPKIFLRILAGYTFKSRHTLSLLYAPLLIESSGSIPRDVYFADKFFPANSATNAIFKFNSYRLTYRYDIIRKPKVEFGIGFTAKIRDAKIALSTSVLSSSYILAEKKNTGFVPIINFRLLWKFQDHLGLLFCGDALAAPQGRAEDVMLAALYSPSGHFSIRAGYRILEGGADNDEVYTFSLFHYASLGLSYTF